MRVPRDQTLFWFHGILFCADDKELQEVIREDVGAGLTKAHGILVI
jgi:hypothetical protein